MSLAPTLFTKLENALFPKGTTQVRTTVSVKVPEAKDYTQIFSHEWQFQPLDEDRSELVIHLDHNCALFIARYKPDLLDFFTMQFRWVLNDIKENSRLHWHLDKSQITFEYSDNTGQFEAPMSALGLEGCRRVLDGCYRQLLNRKEKDVQAAMIENGHNHEFGYTFTATARKPAFYDIEDMTVTGCTYFVVQARENHYRGSVYLKANASIDLELTWRLELHAMQPKTYLSIIIPDFSSLGIDDDFHQKFLETYIPLVINRSINEPHIPAQRTGNFTTPEQQFEVVLLTDNAHQWNQVNDALVKLLKTNASEIYRGVNFTVKNMVND